MNKLVIVLLLCLPFFASAQPGVTSVVDKNGKKYYEHTVEEGNTLWGLQRIYGVSVEEIVAENPDLKEGLKVDQKVYIPVTKESISKIPTSDYKVRKGETLYGLSRKFGTTVDQLITLNPELKDAGLAKGQIIKIPYQEKGKEPTIEITRPVEELPTSPNPFVVDTVVNEDGSEDQVSFQFSDSTINHLVMSHETLYKVSKRFMVSVEEIMRINGLTSTSIKEGQILVIPVKQERVERLEIKPVPTERDPETGPLTFEPKEKYKVALLLPFYLDGGGNSRVQQLATQFYMGAKLAVDSLEKRGLIADLVIYDTKNDSAHIQSILADTNFLTTDLVIGPFYQDHIATLSVYCLDNRIRMVCPVATSEDHLKSNRLLYEAVPNPNVSMTLLAQHMLKNNAQDHIVLVKPELESDIEMYNAFRDAFQSSPVEGVRPKLVETSASSFTGNIRSGVKTLLVIPTNDQKTAIRFMNSLGRWGKRSKGIYVFGTKEWVNFSDINNMYKNKYNFSYASSNFVDYYTDVTINLNKMHRGYYKTDLSRMAIHGYDVLNYFTSEFFFPELENKPTLVMDGFNMQQVGPADGYRNSHVFVIQQEEYELFDTEKGHDD
ncbi:MAG: LysM peptidoglycan-binding domain-containing protein [Crocinitomicaceae bacterium]|nr:LysM peptidoglycan-binding domain-containing protein [Crocinitomicaceae bacterium]